MNEIPLTQDQVALIPGDDHKWLSEAKWYAHWSSHTKSFYAVRSVGPRSDRRLLSMHNVIWEYHNEPIPDGYTVDHIDRDTLNNRLSNLRLATQSQQKQNQGLYGNNTSGYRGVSWSKRRGKWEAYIGVDGKQISLGFFSDKVDAALAYDAAARIHYGEFARLNFPERQEATTSH